MAIDCQAQIYNVSQITYYLKELLAEDEVLCSVAIKGEISGYKRHSSGHIYFSLKDESSALRCVIFRSYASHLAVDLADGMEIVAFGRVALYEKDGCCQLYAQEVFAVGEGKGSAATEQLKRILAAEGLFDEKVKKPLPFFANSVAVVSSVEGAAWADVQKIAKRRWPNIDLRLFATLVQGPLAPQQIAAAIAKADKAGCDILIVTRGGGSAEDLAAFDTEPVVRAIAAVHTPVITAVGHEIDFTLADLAADIRAATPSQAAELAVPDAEAWLARLRHYGQRLAAAAEKQLVEKKGRWRHLADKPIFAQPPLVLAGKAQALDEAGESLRLRFTSALQEKGRQLAVAAQALRMLDPLSVLSRGYALCSTEKGRLLTEAEQAEIGQKLQVRLAKGSLRCRVEEKELAHEKENEF